MAGAKDATSAAALWQSYPSGFSDRQVMAGLVACPSSHGVSVLSPFLIT
jgi:hypothetical protein